MFEAIPACNNPYEGIPAFSDSRGWTVRKNKKINNYFVQNYPNPSKFVIFPPNKNNYVQKNMYFLELGGLADPKPPCFTGGLRPPDPPPLTAPNMRHDSHLLWP